MSISAEAQLSDPSIEDPGKVVRALDSDEHEGLSESEARHRLELFGLNELRAATPPSKWARILGQFKDPLIYLLLGAAAFSLVSWLLERDEPVPIDTIVIVAIVLLNAVLGYIQEERAADAVAALAKMTEVTSSVIREGVRQRIPSTDLVPGDLLVLEGGDAVGADARLIEAASLSTQEASLTGESAPVLKDVHPVAESTIVGEQSSMVFKGTVVTSGSARAIVTATGMGTQMGLVAQMLDVTPENVTPLQKEVSQLGRTISLVAICIAVLVTVSIILISGVNSVSDLTATLLFGVSLAVAAVPEGLPAILSLVLALGVQRMAAHKAIVKNLASVEGLGSATVICTDKTGTLTRGEMTIAQVATASGIVRITGAGYTPRGKAERLDKAPLDDALRRELIATITCGSIANNAGLRQDEQDRWVIEGDPTEAAFLVARIKLRDPKRPPPAMRRVQELAFSSERMMMSIIAVDPIRGDRPTLFSKGAPDVLMARCSHILHGTEIVPFDEERKNQILAQIEQMSAAALRTLAVAYRPLKREYTQEDSETLERRLIFVGVVGINDPPREEAAIAVMEAHGAGIRVLMITGDHPTTARSIASHLGIADADAPVLTGAELDKMDEAALAAALRTTSVFARVAPAHKLKIVHALQSDNQVVAMTGDGVNDAPAIKAANIGIAMGITGTEVSKEAADVVLADDNFATIVRAVREGRIIFENIRKFLRYLISSNIGEVISVFVGVLAASVIGLDAAGEGLVVPLLATQILWINLVTDSLPALALGVDPDSAGVMKRPPRTPQQGVIGWKTWADALFAGTVMAAATLITIDYYLPRGLLEGSGTLDEARTAGFTVLVFAQLFNCFNARSDTASAFHHMFTDKWLLGAVTVSIILQVLVVHVPALNYALATVPLTAEQWLVCIVMGSAVLWCEEARKWVAARLRKR